MFNRLIKPHISRSFFLFGARGTGKSTFLKEFFKKDKILVFDLLDPLLEDELAKRPNSLKDQILANHKNIDWIIIDEVQKLPKLLDIVHSLIESHKLKFALTGSSARKLKYGGANLLAARAFVNEFFPLTIFELKECFDLDLILNFGSLPEIFCFNDAERMEYLRSYAQTYLKEEIWAEQLIRKLDPFRKFLEIAAQGNCEPINYTNVARDVGVDTKTVQSYYQILEDTLIGFFLEAFHQSVRKQTRQNPKFYFFDLGVKKALDGTLTQKLVPNTYAYGKAFEHFVIAEIYRLNKYLKKDFKLSYLQTKDQAEIDLIIEKPNKEILLIEIKSTTQVDERAIKTIKSFIPDIKKSRALVISQDLNKKIIDDVLALHYKEAFDYIFE